MRILIAEDERDMVKIVQMYLEKAGHTVSVAYDGKAALKMLYENKYDLLVSDWMMPGMSGLELCSEIRSSLIPIKIIMLTAKSDVSDEILGLKSGADDYIKKPFEPQLLLLKIQKMFKQENQLRCGGIVLNLENHMVFVDDKELKLTQKELLLLQNFMKNKGKTLPRNKLIEWVWGWEYEGDERTLDTHIKRLRGKIGVGYISTFVGVGYRMDDPNE